MNKKFNKKVVTLSILGLVFIALTFLLHWTFILPVVVILWVNQRELMRKK